MNYVVSYDLNAPGQDYSGVHKAIQSASTGVWCRPLESVWVIQSNLSSASIYNAIAPNLDKTDHLFVAEITSNYFGYLDTKVVNYLKGMF